jgi:ribosomal 50S subunit-associated protein YjgA (DUF615 family)
VQEGEREKEKKRGGKKYNKNKKQKTKTTETKDKTKWLSSTHTRRNARNLVDLAHSLTQKLNTVDIFPSSEMATRSLQSTSTAILTLFS